MGKLDPLAQSLAIVDGGSECTFQIVHDLQKGTQKSFVFHVDLILRQPSLAPAVIVHVGLQAQRSIPPHLQFP
jgi:hypothetical protein